MRKKTLILILLSIHGWLLAWNAMRQSATWDEPAHLASGISHWWTGSFRLYSGNPHLVRMLGAIPVVLQKPATPLDMPLVLVHGKELRKPNLVQGLIPAPIPVERAVVEAESVSAAVEAEKRGPTPREFDRGAA